MKTPLNNDVAIGSDRRCAETPHVNNSRDEGINTPTMDFDDWAEDPFTLAKESDVFSSFTGVDEDGVNDNSNTNASPFPPSSSVLISGKESKSTANSQSNINSSADSQSRKKSHSRQSSQKETNPDIGTGVNLKRTSSVKKRSDYIPISRRKKKPKGMPKRPLSAYNLYFQAERTKIIANQQEENGPRIGFEGLGKIIGKQWRDLSSSDKKDYEKLAEKDSERYRKEMDAYHEKKAKRFAEEDRRAAEQTPVLSGITSLSNSVQPRFDANFVTQQGSLQIVPVGEASGNSILFAHPPKSMVSSISSLPPATASISYRQIQIDQPPSSPRHALHHSNILEALSSHSTVGAVQGPSPHQYFPQSAVACRSEIASYHGIALGPGAATAAVGARSVNCSMPPGMEVFLSDREGIDRKYRVQYTCYSMTRENANKYIENLTRAHSNAIIPGPRPPSTGPNTEYGEWAI